MGGTVLRKYIVSIIILILFFCMNTRESKMEENEPYKTENTYLLTEEKVSSNELTNMSDLIVFGKIIKKVKEFEYEDKYASSIVSYYLCKVDKVIKGECDDSILINYGGTTLPDILTYNENVQLYLVKSGFVENGKDVYCFSSVYQGIVEKEPS